MRKWKGKYYYWQECAQPENRTSLERSIFRLCAYVLQSVFYSLERSGMLSPDDDTDLFCLHYVYLPRISQISYG